MHLDTYLEVVCVFPPVLPLALCFRWLAAHRVLSENCCLPYLSLPSGLVWQICCPVVLALLK